MWKTKMKQGYKSKWTVVCRLSKHDFDNRNDVVNFVAKRKGRIGGILHFGRLTHEELILYREGLRRAGLALLQTRIVPARSAPAAIKPA